MLGLEPYFIECWQLLKSGFKFPTQRREDAKNAKEIPDFLLLCALCNLASLRWKIIKVVDLSSYEY